MNNGVYFDEVKKNQYVGMIRPGMRKPRMRNERPFMDWLLRHRRTKVAETDRLIPNDTGACPLLYLEVS